MSVWQATVSAGRCLVVRIRGTAGVTVGRIDRVPGSEMVDLSAVDLDELATAALGDQGYFEHRWLIDPDSGEISLNRARRD